MERQPKPPDFEVHESEWVPMRTRELGQPHRQEHGFVGWTPAHILYGDKLAINIQAFQDLADRMRFSAPVELISININERQEGDIGNFSTSKSGEVTVTSIRSKNPKPKPGIVHYDQASNRLVIAVNFSGINSYLEGKLAQGRDNPHFFDEYAAMVDKSVKKGLSYMPLLNLFNNDVAAYQFVNQVVVKSIFAAFFALIMESVDSVNGSFSLTEGALEALLYYQASYLLDNAYSVIRSKYSDNKYRNAHDFFLKTQFQEKNYSHLFAPTQALEHIIIPFMSKQLFREPLIKTIYEGK